MISEVHLKIKSLVRYLFFAAVDLFYFFIWFDMRDGLREC